MVEWGCMNKLAVLALPTKMVGCISHHFTYPFYKWLCLLVASWHCFKWIMPLKAPCILLKEIEIISSYRFHRKLLISEAAAVTRANTWMMLSPPKLLHTKFLRLQSGNNFGSTGLSWHCNYPSSVKTASCFLSKLLSECWTPSSPVVIQVDDPHCCSTTFQPHGSIST